MENTQTLDAFAFIVKGHKYTCISNTTLSMLSSLGVTMVIANETLPGWGYSAKDIKEELNTLGVDYKQYRYRPEAQFNTKQLQSLISLYLSLKDPDAASEAPRFI